MSPDDVAELLRKLAGDLSGPTPPSKLSVQRRLAGALAALPRTSRTRADKEGVSTRTWDEFRGEWEGKDVFLRFEDKKFSDRDA